MLLQGCRPFKREDAELYVSRRWWSGLTCGDLLDKAADLYPERPAIADSEALLTYAQLRETADRLAIALLELGIRPLDRVLHQLPNWHQFAYIYFALQKIGAMIDEAGDITLCGRLKDIINRGGESISAPEIESLICQHPDVVLVGVVGMPDHVMGERVCAYIQPKAGARMDFAAIVAHLQSCGASVLHIPERIEFVNAMPLTQTEKVDKQRLRENIESKLLAEAAHKVPS